MARVTLALVVSIALAASGCGGGGSTTEKRPTVAAPVHHGDAGQRAAREVAAYKATVNDVLASYSATQRHAFRALRGAKDAPAFVAALGRLRRATARAANRLEATRPPGAVAVPHRRFVAAFRSLARIIQTAIDARNRSDFGRLRRVGRRLASGEFSRPITAAAKEIDAGLS
jgi:predicted lipid-binding transport protein (Tim44 family)